MAADKATFALPSRLPTSTSGPTSTDKATASAVQNPTGPAPGARPEPTSGSTSMPRPGPTSAPVPAKVIANPTATEAKILTDVNSSGIGVLADTAMGLATKTSTTNPILSDKYKALLTPYERKLGIIRDELGEKALVEIREKMNDIMRVLIAIETSVVKIPDCRQIKVVGNRHIELADLLKIRFGVVYVKIDSDPTDVTRFIITFGPSIDDEIKQYSARLNELNEMKMSRAADEVAAAKRQRKE